MKKIELHKGRKFYLLGIGGISMSSLAVFLKEMGNIVDGSDSAEGDAVMMLRKNGIAVDLELNKEKLSQADYVVCSSAIRGENEWLVFAKSLGKPIFTRGELLGAISKEYKKVIAVAGSHGKTTTTAMLYEILKSAGKEPTLHLGGFRCEDMQNFHIGGEEFFVTEACEYYDNFLNLQPYISVITNVEKEHMDYFKTFERQLESFEKFKSQSQFVLEQDDSFSAKNIRHKKDGTLSFELCKDGEKLFRLGLKICEDVNVKNCINAYRACKVLGLSDQQIKEGLENFKGVKTRFEKVECEDFENVILDYSHHPTEIEKAIYSAKKIFKEKELVVVFQPHTFSRTKDLLDDFVKVLKMVDRPILFKTYSAREVESDGVSAKSLSEILNTQNPNTMYADDIDCLMEILKTIKKDVVLLFVGAGDLPALLHKNKFIS